MNGNTVEGGAIPGLKIETWGTQQLGWAYGHEAASAGWGGSIFISVSAFWQRVQTFCQMP